MENIYKWERGRAKVLLPYYNVKPVENCMDILPIPIPIHAEISIPNSDPCTLATVVGPEAKRFAVYIKPVLCQRCAVSRWPAFMHISDWKLFAI